MCGRFALFSDINTIKRYADTIAQDIDWQPNYNVSPGMDIPVMTVNYKKKVILSVRWGFVPHYAKETYNIINARAETIQEKNTFKDAYRKGRCIIPANGFYEWRRKDKQPYYFTLQNQPLLFIAGIMTENENRGKGFAIITTAANSIVEPVHHRMPVILAEQNIGEYLFEEDTGKLPLLPYPADKMRVYPVSKKVNSSRNNDPSLIEENASPELEYEE